ncbi:hypothetical protein J6590_020238 [Homalodisca vitripennis]|nr:hypothetical protein J6590_020238 [Homalodisca vitripennis]
MAVRVHPFFLLCITPPPHRPTGEEKCLGDCNAERSFGDKAIRRREVLLHNGHWQWFLFPSQKLEKSGGGLISFLEPRQAHLTLSIADYGSITDKLSGRGVASDGCGARDDTEHTLAEASLTKDSHPLTYHPINPSSLLTLP